MVATGSIKVPITVKGHMLGDGRDLGECVFDATLVVPIAMTSQELVGDLAKAVLSLDWSTARIEVA